MRAAALLLAVTLAAPALAEVLADGSQVQVRPTERGPWTPESLPTASTLNATGDLTGDGYPGWAVGTRGVLTAWSRPTTGTLELAFWNGGAWSRWTPIEVKSLLGSPIVAQLETGWLVAWTDGPPSPSVLLSGVLPGGGSSRPESIADGQLVAAMTERDVLHLITMAPDGWLVGTTIRVESVLPSVPITIDRIAEIRLDNLGGITPAPHLPGFRDRRDEAAGLARASARTLNPWASIRLHRGARDDSSTFALVTYWLSAHELSYAELTDRGAAAPATIRSLRPFDGLSVETAIARVRRGD